MKSLIQFSDDALLNFQLDVMETIGKLLFNNSVNQSEFKQIDGYSFFLRLINSLSDDEDTQLFLEVPNSNLYVYILTILMPLMNFRNTLTLCLNW